MDQYLKTTYGCSQLITKSYSTSFSLAIKTLAKPLRDPICGIYGFVRMADEIVDTFHEYDKASLLERFTSDAFQAIEERISLNPVLHSFQKVVNEYKIDHGLIHAFIKSMEMDLHYTVYGSEHFDEYVYGSAEVVGLMCLKVFCGNDEALYERLTPAARKLGSAFQKINFLRDVQSDFEDRGRIYFPGVEWKNFTNLDKQRIEAEILQEFQDAYAGILNLPKTSRLGVYLAYMYYLALFRKIQRVPASRIMHERIRVPDKQKIGLLLGSYVKHRLNYF